MLSNYCSYTLQEAYSMKLPSTMRIFLFCFSILLSVSSPVFASSLYVAGNGNMGINPSGVDARGWSAPSYNITVYGPQISPLSGQTEGTWAKTGVFDVDAKMFSGARASYGALGVRSMSWANSGSSYGNVEQLVHALESNNTWFYGANSDAAASFSDTWNVNAGSYNGTKGRLAVTVQLDGTRTTPYFDHASNLMLNLVNLSHGGRTDMADLNAGTYTFCADFVYGVDNNIVMNMAAGTTAGGRVHNFYYHQFSGGGIQDVDFLHTATITDLAFYDANGNLITDYLFSAESGHNYFKDNQPVPEPSTLLLLGGGFGAMFLIRRRIKASNG